METIASLHRAGIRVSSEAIAAVAAAGLVTSVASVDGGYAPTSWGWTALAVGWMAAIALVVRDRFAVGRLELAMVGGLAALALWTLLSARWSHDAGSSVLSFQRLLVYLAVPAAIFVAFRPRASAGLVAGTWIAATVVCGYGLLTRLYPNSFAPPSAIAGNRLAPPIGYWNGLGLLAAIGVVLALGVAASRSRFLAPLAAASCVPLLLTLYFTFSRGGWLAGAVGLVVALALDPHRVRLALATLAVAPFAALAVALAARDKELTTVSTPPPAASAVGGHLAGQAALLALGAAIVAALLVELARRVAVSPKTVRTGSLALAAVAAACVVAGGVAVVHRSGSPTASNDLNARLFSLSSTGRVDLWRVAWHDFRAHPLLGSGAGTYQRVWLAQRPNDSQVVNAHDLYLETAAELGLPGLLLLLLALAPPLVAARRARGMPLMPVALAVYCAFLVHALVDWDWQLPGVTLAALVPAAALLLAGAGESAPRVQLRYLAAGAAALLAIVAGLGLAGNRAAAAAASATAHERYDHAESEARTAHRWQPWSARPWQLLGEAQLEHGDLAGARASLRAAIAKDRLDWQLWLDLASAEPSRRTKRADVGRARALNPRSPEIQVFAKTLGL